MTTAATLPLRGVDFTSRPTPRKPVTLAEGRLVGDVLRLERLRALPDEAAFAASLREPGPWLGGFDLPFGLPRELVTALGWTAAWHVYLQSNLSGKITVKAARGNRSSAF